MNRRDDVFENKEELNLWKSIWLKPKETVRYAIDHKSMKFAITLALIAGVFDTLNGASQNNMGDSMSVSRIFVLAIFLGPFLGLIGWWIGAGIATIVGTWLGGIGEFTELKMAFAISYIPIILGGLVWVPDFLILSESLFIEDLSVTGWKLVWLLFSGLISIVLGIWSFVITVIAIAEAHQFSAWRGFWTAIIPATLIVIVLSVFLLPFFLITF